MLNDIAILTGATFYVKIYKWNYKI
jgi:hypothetical protein